MPSTVRVAACWSNARWLAVVASALGLAACGGSSSGGSTPPPSSYTLGGTVSGLASTGLVLASNGATVSVSSTATSFVFANSLATGTAYAVTVQSSPGGQTCSVANGTGTMGTANISNVVVTCSDQAYTIGGTVSGLNASGLVLANGTDRLTVSSGATTFVMPTSVAFSSSYQVTVATQPTGLSCSVQNGSGSMGAGNVINISVTCTDQPYSLGGTISGLTSGTVTLANGTDSVQVASGATTFTFPKPVAFSATYAVTVSGQPTGMTCSVSSGSGTMPANNVTTVAVTCSAQSYTVGGPITGLTTDGLQLADNGTQLMSIGNHSTSFQMPPVAYLGSYSITVVTQPTGETCTVSNGSGVVGAGPVNTVLITCSINSYTLGGVISGLGATSGLVLTDGTDQLSVAANANKFTMPTSLAYGSPYSVTVKTQPGTPGFNCSVTSGSGTMPGANVTTVQVTCTPNAWMWEGGASTAGSAGAYPATIGTSGLAYVPSARSGQMSWKSADGKFWLYGGTPDSGSPAADIDDVWSYDPASQKWTWVSGSQTTSAALAANYGSLGVAAATNTPGARHAGAVWVDGTGQVWLFGGQDAAGNVYNDLWTYSPATGQWTWQGGTTSANSAAVAPPNPVPRSRAAAATWVDKTTGKFWMYGGLVSVGPPAVVLSDLWTFDPTTQQWTLVAGDALGTSVTNGTYPAAFGGTGTPGARAGAATWVDGAGTLWLFGGAGYDDTGTDAQGSLNDVWSYDTAGGQWTFVGGSKKDTGVGGAAANYGPAGTAGTGYIPGGRGGSVGWIDSAGLFWLFGGADLATGNQFNDLWSFDPASKKWTYVKGDQNASTSSGQYGQLGISASSNQPGARFLSSGWTDSSGHLWLFGGSGNDGATPTPTSGNLNDLWTF